MRRSDTSACQPDRRCDTETRRQGSGASRLPRHLSTSNLKERRFTSQPSCPAHRSFGEPHVRGRGGVCLGGVRDFIGNDEEPESVAAGRALTPFFCAVAPKYLSSPTRCMV